MNSFSINRFWKTFCWVLATNFRKLLMWTIGAALVVFMAEMIVWAMTHYYEPVTMINQFSDWGGVFMVIAAIIMISSVVSSVNEKCKREAFLMIPASNLEKYLSLIFYTSVICILCIFVALVVGDSLRMAWFWVRDTFDYTPYTEGEDRFLQYANGECVYWYSSAIPKFIELFRIDAIYGEFKCPVWFGIMRTFFTFALLLWIHSLYTLGGTLLRKYSFVVTTVFFILCVLLFAKMMNYYNLFLFKSNWYSLENGPYMPPEISVLAYIMNIVLPLLTCLNYWASFQIFKGFQLISNKWTNYDILKR